MTVCLHTQPLSCVPYIYYSLVDFGIVPGLTTVDSTVTLHVQELVSLWTCESHIVCTSWALMMLSNVFHHGGSNICCQPTVHQCSCFLTNLPSFFLVTTPSGLRTVAFFVCWLGPPCIFCKVLIPISIWVAIFFLWISKIYSCTVNFYLLGVPLPKMVFFLLS